MNQSINEDNIDKSQIPTDEKAGSSPEPKKDIQNKINETAENLNKDSTKKKPASYKLIFLGVELFILAVQAFLIFNQNSILKTQTSIQESQSLILDKQIAIQEKQNSMLEKQTKASEVSAVAQMLANLDPENINKSIIGIGHLAEYGEHGIQALINIANSPTEVRHTALLALLGQGKMQQKEQIYQTLNALRKAESTSGFWSGDLLSIDTSYFAHLILPATLYLKDLNTRMLDSQLNSTSLKDHWSKMSADHFTDTNKVNYTKGLIMLFTYSAHRLQVDSKWPDTKRETSRESLNFIVHFSQFCSLLNGKEREYLYVPLVLLYKQKILPKRTFLENYKIAEDVILKYFTDQKFLDSQTI